MLDPDLVPEGLFRPGLSPYSDLVRPARRREGTGDSRGAAGAGSGLRRTQPLPGQAGGPVGPSNPGPGRSSPRHRHGAEGRAPAPVPAGRSTRELDRGGTGQTLARSQRQGTPDQGAPCAGPMPPSAPNGLRRAWPRNRRTTTGPRWPPRPGSGAAATGKRPATPTVPTWPPSARPPSTESADLRPAAAARRPRLPGRSPRPLSQGRADRPARPGTRRSTSAPRRPTRNQHGIRTRRTAPRSPLAPAGSPPRPPNQPASVAP